MTWAKGQSGNPGGRRAKSKIELEAQNEARRLTPRAIEALKRNLTCGNPSAEVAAANSLLDRGWGKAAQIIDANVTTTIVQDERIAAFREEVRQARSAEHTVQ